MVFRINSLGDTIWTRTYGGINDDGFNDVAISSGGEIIVVGFSQDSLAQQDALLAKYDFNGDLLFDTVYGDANQELFNEFVELQNQDLIIIGSKERNSPIDFDSWTVRLDKDGVFKDEKFNGNHLSGDFDQLGKVITKYQNKDLIAIGMEQIQQGYPDLLPVAELKDV